MTTPPPQVVSPDQVGRTTQIIVGGLILGLLSFGVIAYVIAQRRGELDVVSMIAVAFFVINVVVSLVMSRLTSAAAIRQIAAVRPLDWRAALAPVYQTRTILANAPLEGAGFFNGIAFIIDGHWINLAIVAVILALMAITFPAQSKFEIWADQVQREQAL